MVYKISYKLFDLSYFCVRNALLSKLIFLKISLLIFRTKSSGAVYTPWGPVYKLFAMIYGLYSVFVPIFRNRLRPDKLFAMIYGLYNISFSIFRNRLRLSKLFAMIYGFYSVSFSIFRNRLRLGKFTCDITFLFSDT